jgi:hypothetical protein
VARDVAVSEMVVDVARLDIDLARPHPISVGNVADDHVVAVVIAVMFAHGGHRRRRIVLTFGSAAARNDERCAEHGARRDAFDFRLHGPGRANRRLSRSGSDFP